MTKASELRKKLRKQLLKIESDRRKKIAQKLKDLREEAGYSQEEIADSIGVTRTSITNIEAGRQGLTVDNLIELCDLYGLTPNDVLL